MPARRLHEGLWISKAVGIRRSPGARKGRKTREGFSTLLKSVLAVSLLGLAFLPARADEAVPARTDRVFSPTLAQGLRELRRFADVEAAIGGAGAVVGSSEESDGPHVVQAWRDPSGGLLRAFVYRSGDFSLVMRTAGSEEDIVMNSFGAFVCPTCNPPVNACGRRPWWVPHDVHWDNFDCGCTLAGPQSVRVGRC